MLSLIQKQNTRDKFIILCTIGYSLSTEKEFTENWGDDFKQRAAISSLFGKAITWQEEIVVNLVQWNDWLDGLR